MEPVTHFLTGACIGRAGFNRKSAYATLAAVLAAEAADMDILWGFAGPVEELKHHRGITHTFIAAPVIAAVVLGVVWLIDRWRKSRRRGAANAAKATAHPSASAASRPPLRMTDGIGVRWGWLYLAALVAALSHLLLDWTNNYGVRPFFPFNPKWYMGSIVFIAEPLLWGCCSSRSLCRGSSALPIRRSAQGAIGLRGRGWAIFALSRNGCGLGLALV